MTGAGCKKQDLCFAVSAVNGSGSIYRAADVKRPNRKPTAMRASGFVQTKHNCGNRNQPQTTTGDGNHSYNGLLETSNGKRVS